MPPSLPADPTTSRAALRGSTVHGCERCELAAQRLLESTCVRSISSSDDAACAIDSSRLASCTDAVAMLDSPDGADASAECAGRSGSRRIAPATGASASGDVSADVALGVLAGAVRGVVADADRDESAVLEEAAVWVQGVLAAALRGVLAAAERGVSASAALDMLALALAERGVLADMERGVLAREERGVSAVAALGELAIALAERDLSSAAGLGVLAPAERGALASVDCGDVSSAAALRV